MQSKEYYYWASQCQKGFQLLEDEDDYSDLAENTLYMDYEIWVYKVDDVIYARWKHNTYIIN